MVVFSEIKSQTTAFRFELVEVTCFAVFRQSFIQTCFLPILTEVIYNSLLNIDTLVNLFGKISTEFFDLLISGWWCVVVHVNPCL